MALVSLQRASEYGRPLCFLLCALLLPSVSHADGCVTDYFDLEANVTYVYDGDTVRLDNGERVRLIGFDTPEMNYKKGSPEPLAEAAKKQLKDILYSNNNHINLRFGKVRHDRYKRLLAHAFLDNGENIGAMMLEKGLATSLVIPPNTWALECYQQHESDARKAGIGIWALPRYQVVNSKDLKPETDKGYKILRGKVIQVKHTRNSIWLSLEGFVALRISRRDLENFTSYDPSILKGRHVIARGWLHNVEGELVMRIRH